MFKYKLNNFYHIDDYSNDFIKHYLESIGIQKIDSFLMAPEREDELDPYLLNNMEKGIELLKKHIDNKSKMFLIQDCDVDGLTSSAIIYNYIKRISPDISIELFIHNAKEHGIEKVEDIPEGIDLVIIPDAGSSQVDEMKKLTDKGMDILILDHHEVDKILPNDKVVIINNQISPDFDNKFLSGAGVVFKFVQAYDEKYLTGSYWKDYYDLATLGIISDMMDSTTLDNNYIFSIGLHNIKNKFFKALLEKQSYSVSSPTSPNKIDIAFYVTPALNGVIRVGEMEQKKELFRAISDNNINEDSVHTFRGVSKNETFYERVAREAVNTKQKQDNIIKKVSETIFTKIEEQGLQNNQLIIYKTSTTNPNEVPQVLTGLIAMKIAARYSRNTLVLRPTTINGVQCYCGSGRGKIAEGFNSLRDFLLGSGLVEYAAGHACAHGVGIKEENIPLLLNYANEKLKDVDFGSDVVEVCGVNPPTEALNEFAEHNYLFGNGIPEIKVVETTTMYKTEIKVMGQRQDTVKFTINNIICIKFHAKELIDQILNYKDDFFLIEVVGRPQINEFNGMRNLQLIVDNVNIKEVNNLI